MTEHPRSQPGTTRPTHSVDAYSFNAGIEAAAGLCEVPVEPFGGGTTEPAAPVHARWIRQAKLDEPALPKETPPRPDVAGREATPVRYVKTLEDLVQCLIDNDPEDLAADGGIRVIDVWRKDAERALRCSTGSDKP